MNQRCILSLSPSPRMNIKTSNAYGSLSFSPSLCASSNLNPPVIQDALYRVKNYISSGQSYSRHMITMNDIQDKKR